MSLDPDMLIGPGKPGPAYQRMMARWFRVHVVLGGTETMREASTDVLPMHPRESSEAYNERKNRSVLTNFTEQTIVSWVGTVFEEPLDPPKDLPQELTDFLPDIDLLGNNLTVFARNWFKYGLEDGFACVMVDYPIRPETPGRTRTLADDRRDKLRPYWVLLENTAVIGAKTEVVNGVEVITQLRLIEQRLTEDSTEFEDIYESTIKVFDLIRDNPQKPYVQVRIFAWRDISASGRQSKKTKNGKQWTLLESYVMEFEQIPIVIFYSDHEDTLLAKPPCLDLADLNIQHYQSCSDQTSILTVARFPMLAISGSLPDGEIKVGPNQWLHTPDVNGKFYYVEPTGAAIASGNTEIEALERRMGAYGAQYLKKAPGRQTATARALDTAESTSPLKDAALRFLDAMDTALYLTGKWIGVEFKGHVSLNLDNTTFADNQADLQTLVAARTSRDLSREAFLEELQRRGVLSHEFDPAEDLTKLESEAALTGQSSINIDPTNPGNPKPAPAGA